MKRDPLGTQPGRRRILSQDPMLVLAIGFLSPAFLPYLEDSRWHSAFPNSHPLWALVHQDGGR